jgi:hypothetical protein
MGVVTVAAGFVLSLAGFGAASYLIYTRFFIKRPEDIMLELAGILKVRYYPKGEDNPAFASGTYSGRGVTLDVLNEKGYMDRWHPHSRVVVSVSKEVRDTYIVAYQGRFYSRKLGEVNVNNPRFGDKYILLSSSPGKAEKLITSDVANWIINLDMPFILSDGHVLFHQEKHFKDKKRIKHIIDAMVYIATMAERIK